MDFTDLENTTRIWRTHLCTLKPLALAAASVFTLAVSLLSYLALIYGEDTSWAWIVCPIVLFVLWSTRIWKSTSQMSRIVESSRSSPKYPNIFMLWKGLGQVVALTFFTFLDEQMKGKNLVLALTLSLGVYCHLMMVMVLYAIREDFDVTAGFLAASFELFFQSSEGWGTVALVVVTIMLCSLKNFLVEGKIAPVKKQRPGSEKRAAAKSKSAVIEMETIPLPSANSFEQNLAIFRTDLYSYTKVLAVSGLLSFLMGGYFFTQIVGEVNMPRYAPFIRTACVVCAIVILRYSWERKAYVEDVDEVRKFHNLYTLLKSVGQVLSLSLFTFIDGHLESQETGLAIGLCTTSYLHLVIMMVILRENEDFDIVGGFVAAGFGLFYKLATGWYTVCLILVSITLVSLKNYVIGGKGIMFVDWDMLPL